MFSIYVVHLRFFFHEHARKIGIWAWAFVISPYLGPFLSAIIANFESWRTSFWINFLVVGLAVVFVALLTDETMYDRDNCDQQPPKPAGYINYKIQMLSGYYGAKCQGRTTVWQSTKDLAYLLTRPYFTFINGTTRFCDIADLLVFYMLTFMWAVGINQTLVLFLYPPPEAGGYGFSNLAAGLFYISPMVAVIVGELFGHFFSTLRTK
jgi:MFS family permease